MKEDDSTHMVLGIICKWLVVGQTYFDVDM